MFKGGVLFVILLIFLVSIISVSSVNDKDKKGPYIDPDIEKELEKNPEAFVIVSVKEPDDDILTKEEKGKFKIRDDNFTKLKRQKSQDKVLSKLGKREFKEVSRISAVSNAFTGKTKKTALKKLEKDPDVDAVYLNAVIAQPRLDLSLPLVQADVAQNYLRNNYGLNGGEGETICIIDTGIDKTNQDLTGSRFLIDDPNNRPPPFLLEKCFCTASNCCPNGQVTQEGIGAARDDSGHGTAVAGVAAAKAASPTGVTGVAPASNIIMVRAYDYNRRGFNFADLLEAVNYCKAKNPTVISMSLGSNSLLYTGECIIPQEDNKFLVTQAIKNTINENIPVVVASGEDDCPPSNSLANAFSTGCTAQVGWLECVKETISVTSTHGDKILHNKYLDNRPPETGVIVLSDFSDYAAGIIDIAAPGDIISKVYDESAGGFILRPAGTDEGRAGVLLHDIYTTWPISKGTGGHIVIQGTSFAAPHVAGAIALLQQYTKKIKGERKLNVAGIERALKANPFLIDHKSTIFPHAFAQYDFRDYFLFDPVPLLQISNSGFWITTSQDVDGYLIDPVLGRLVRRIVTPPPTLPSGVPGSPCTTNGECSNGLICVNAKCAQPTPTPIPEPGAFTIDARPTSCTSAHVSITEFLANPPSWYYVYKNTDSSNTAWDAYLTIPTDELDITGLTSGSLNSFFVRATYAPPTYSSFSNVDSNKIYVRLPACDSKAPDLILVEPKNRTYNSTEYLGLNFTVHDNTAVNGIWYRIDNSSNISVAGNETLNIFTIRTSALNLTQIGAPESLDYINSTQRTLHLWAKDIYGNINYTNVTFARNVFEIRVNTPSLIYTNIGDIKFNVTVNLATSQYNIKNVSLYGSWTGNFTINETNSSGLANADYIFVKNLSSTNDSVYSWNIKVCDTSGYCRITGTGAILLDKTPPVVNLLTSNNSWTTYFFSYGVSDSTPVTCYLYGDFNGTYALNRSTNQNLTNDSVNSKQITLGEFFTFSIPGIRNNNTGYLWNVMCNDTLGNYAFNSTNFTVKVDTIVPLINFTTGTTTNKSLAQKSIFANVSASDLNLVNITINLYNSSGYFKSVNINSSGSYNFTNLNDDIYDLYAVASDYAGNTNTTEIRTIILDNAYPLVYLVSPANNTGYSSLNQPAYAFNVTDVLIDNCTLTINSTVKQTFTNIDVNKEQNIYVSNLSKGKYYWNISCTDTLNRINTSSTNLVKIDYLPPAITTIDEVYHNGKEKVFRIIIWNNATKIMDNITWTFNTGESIINGTIPTTLSYSDLSLAYVTVTYSDYKLYTISATASYQVDPETVLNGTYTTTADTRIFNISDLTAVKQNYSDYSFSFTITNVNGNNQSAANWSLNTGISVINSTNPVFLDRLQSTIINVSYNYTSQGNFTVTASGIPEQYTKPQSIKIENRKLEVSELSLLNVSSLTSITRFIVKNRFYNSLSDVSWLYDSGNSAVSSLQNSTLSSNETILIYMQYTYPGSNTYNINATAVSDLEKARDSLNKTITI